MIAGMVFPFGITMYKRIVNSHHVLNFILPLAITIGKYPNRVTAVSSSAVPCHYATTYARVAFEGQRLHSQGVEKRGVDFYFLSTHSSVNIPVLAVITPPWFGGR